MKPGVTTLPEASSVFPRRGAVQIAYGGYPAACDADVGALRFRAAAVDKLASAYDEVEFHAHSSPLRSILPARLPVTCPFSTAGTPPTRTRSMPSGERSGVSVSS